MIYATHGDHCAPWCVCIRTGKHDALLMVWAAATRSSKGTPCARLSSTTRRSLSHSAPLSGTTTDLVTLERGLVAVVPAPRRRRRRWIPRHSVTCGCITCAFHAEAEKEAKVWDALVRAFSSSSSQRRRR